MTISLTVAATSIVPSNVFLLFGVVVLIAGSLVFYALYKKGDVRAVFSHGRTIFKLEAKERNSKAR